MDNISLIVEGMSCSHCENRIKKALNALNGVKKVEIYLADKIVDVNYDSSLIDADTIKNEIENTGYNVI